MKTIFRFQKIQKSYFIFVLFFFETRNLISAPIILTQKGNNLNLHDLGQLHFSYSAPQATLLWRKTVINVPIVKKCHPRKYKYFEKISRKNRFYSLKKNGQKESREMLSETNQFYIKQIKRRKVRNFRSKLYTVNTINWLCFVHNLLVAERGCYNICMWHAVEYFKHFQNKWLQNKQCLFLYIYIHNNITQKGREIVCLWADKISWEKQDTSCHCGILWLTEEKYRRKQFESFPFFLNALYYAT